MLRSVDDLERYAVSTTDGPVGRVRDFQIDDRRWMVEHLVVEPSLFFDRRRVLVSPELVGRTDASARRFHLTLTTDWVRQGQGMDVAPATRGARLTRSKNARGYVVHGIDDAIGHVTDLIVDDESWEIRYLVVDTNRWRFGNKTIVAAGWVREVFAEEEKLFVGLTRSAITGSPPWNGSATIHRDYETQLYNHYGRPSSDAAPTDEPRREKDPQLESASGSYAV